MKRFSRPLEIVTDHLRTYRAAMIDRIEVHAGQKRGKPDVILVGALAQILAFTQQKKKAASMKTAVGS